MTPSRPAVRLLVFLHGTTIMHAGAAGKDRAERVAQSKVGSGYGLRDSNAYIVIGRAADKLRAWAGQGAQISYLSSHRNRADLNSDAAVIRRCGFPPGPVLARRRHETYGQVVESVMPDVLIEDDCESIGDGEISYSQLGPAARGRIHSIIVPEFGGIDHLPDSLAELAHG